MFYQLILLNFFVNVVMSLQCYTASSPNCKYNSTCSYNIKECSSNSLPIIRGGIYCTTLIKMVNNEILIGNMDCMYDQETSKTCKNQSECFPKLTKKNSSYLHCCCDQHLCNLNFTLSNSSEIDSVSKISFEEEKRCGKLLCKNMYGILIVLMILFVLMNLIICFICRKKVFQTKNSICKRFFRNKFSTEEFDPSMEKINPNEEKTNSLSDQYISFNELIIENLLKRGRFSSIHQGEFDGKKVAIKILSNSNSNSNTNNEINQLFLNEKNIYSLPFMQHPNILKYYGYSLNGINSYIITELSCYGSLRDVLRSRLLKDENELLLICKQISSGVEYLHHDYRDRNNNEKNNGRSSIAHRDLKSENILYINDHQIVICDFAMSMKLDQNQNFPNEQQQIGTARYMSPEILSGSIGYETNALLKCDVYALGIIFWEILSRFPTEDSNEIYQMPYEYQLRSQNLNINPSINEMLQIINLSNPSNRPLIQTSWKNSSRKSLYEICLTMEQCWDQNPDGRINAALVAVRMQKL